MENAAFSPLQFPREVRRPKKRFSLSKVSVTNYRISGGPSLDDLQRVSSSNPRLSELFGQLKHAGLNGNRRSSRGAARFNVNFDDINVSMTSSSGSEKENSTIHDVSIPAEPVPVIEEPEDDMVVDEPELPRESEPDVTHIENLHCKKSLSTIFERDYTTDEGDDDHDEDQVEEDEEQDEQIEDVDDHEKNVSVKDAVQKEKAAQDEISIHDEDTDDSEEDEEDGDEVIEAENDEDEDVSFEEDEEPVQEKNLSNLEVSKTKTIEEEAKKDVQNNEDDDCEQDELSDFHIEDDDNSSSGDDDEEDENTDEDEQVEREHESSSIAVNTSIQMKQKTPEVHKKPKTPEVQKKLKTPEVQKKPKTPEVREKQKTPNVQEKQKTPEVRKDVREKASKRLEVLEEVNEQVEVSESNEPENVEQDEHTDDESIRRPPKRMKHEKKPKRQSVAQVPINMTIRDGSRQSRRQRIAPLEYWRGQRPVYRRDSTGLGTFKIVSIDEGFKAWTPKVGNKTSSTRTKRKVAPTVQVIKERMDAFNLSIHESGFEKLKAKNEKTKKKLNTKDHFILGMEDLQWKPSKMSSGVDMAIAHKDEDGAHGFIKFAPKSTKERQKTSEYTTSFTVVFGVITVEIDDQSPAILQTGGFLRVKPESFYSMKNVRNDEAIVQFYVIKH